LFGFQRPSSRSKSFAAAASAPDDSAMTGFRLAAPALAQAAALLVAARHDGRRLVRLPDALTPGTDAEGYAIQARVTQALGWPVAGWKAGLGPAGDTSSAPLYAPLVRTAPARFDPAALALFGIEGEIAFRLGRTLPAGERPHDRASVMDAIASAHAAIEILDSRFTTLQGRSRFEMLADSFNNGGFVAGPARTDWRALDLAGLPVTLAIDGKTIFTGRGTHPVGDPLAPVLWLANFLNASGAALQEGDYVTTGTCTGFARAHAGAHVLVRFEGLGEAEVSFASH
jgi:2-keto-4-pentenoate hydratase